MSDTTPTTQQHYFASDGNFGDAAGLVILDTGDWPAGHWEAFDAIAESERHITAERIMLGHGSIDQQDCPGVTPIGETPCGFSGYVYRHFEYPSQGEEGGYTWTCPNCGSEYEYEGIDPDDPDHFIGVVKIEPVSETGAAIEEPCS